MALKDLVIPTVEVPVGPNGSFAVRGLSSTDIEKLLAAHGSDFKSVWEDFLKNDIDLSKLELGQIGPMISDVVKRIPAAMLDLIGLAADADDDDMKMLTKLPIGVQARAVGAVLGITLNTDGDWAKMLEMAMSMIGGANGALAELVAKQLPKG